MMKENSGKDVAGRKTDAGDAQWLATLAADGPLHGSFVPRRTDAAYRGS
jgi:hypothetical protein